MTHYYSSPSLKPVVACRRSYQARAFILSAALCAVSLIPSHLLANMPSNDASRSKKQKTQLQQSKNTAHNKTGVTLEKSKLAASNAKSSAAAVAPPAPTLKSAEIETQLVQIYAQISQQRLTEALRLTDNLITARPNFRLAHLIRGDLLLAKTQAVHTIGSLESLNQYKAANTPKNLGISLAWNDPLKVNENLKDLREEAYVRLRGYREKPPENSVPRYLLQLREDQHTAIIVDTKKSRLYVYENANGRPRFVADYYFTQGKAGSDKAREGDQKTPIGVYQITSSMPKSRLPDFYGAGALPINYPNEIDKLEGKTGHGIWLHGVPSNTYSRPPRASDGCVVLANPDLEAISSKVQPGFTPVVISDKVEWLSLDDWNNERQSLNSAIETWRADWESLSSTKYLSHYSQKFSADGMDWASWTEHKRQVNTTKQWAKVAIRNISMLRYPGKNDMVVVTFDQEYHSNNLSNNIKKKQYWIREAAGWRIIFEGLA